MLTLNKLLRTLNFEEFYTCTVKYHDVTLRNFEEIFTWKF